MKPTQTFLSSAIAQFRYYQQLGEQTLAQIPEDQFSFKINEKSNNINVLIQHLSGNMLSRWTDFLNSDGEKAERKRDQESKQSQNQSLAFGSPIQQTNATITRDRKNNFN